MHKRIFIVLLHGKILKVLLIIIVAFSFIGCWGRRSLKDLMPIAAFGIDKKEDKYILTSQLINVSEIASKKGDSQSAVTVYSTEGRSISEAFRKLTTKAPRRLYASHLRVLVFGEEFAKEGINDALNFFVRDPDLRSDFYMLVAKDKRASEVLKVLTPLDKIPGNGIYSSLESTEKAWSAAITVKLLELLGSIGTEGKEPILTGIEMLGKEDIGMDKRNIEISQPPTSIEVGTLAVFKEDKLVGWLTETESAMTNSILGKVRNTVRPIPYDTGNLVSLELKHVRRKIKVINDGGNPKIMVNFKIKSVIKEVQGDIKIKDPQVIKEIEKKAEETIGKKEKETINKLQKSFNSDIFGFGQEVRKQQPSLWNKVGSDWKEHWFSKVPVEVSVKVNVSDTGRVMNKVKIK